MLRLRAAVFGAVFCLAGAAYGYFLHRDHLFPYHLLNPRIEQAQAAEEIGTWASPWYRARYSVMAGFPQKADLVMLGDSLTEAPDWQTLLPGLSVANQGICGDTTAGLLARLDLVERTGAKTVAIMFGINDFREHPDQTPDMVFGRYMRAISELAKGRRIVVQSTLFMSSDLAINAHVAELDRRLKSACDGTRCEYLDLNKVIAPFGVLPDKLSVDGLHLNAAGYKLWGDALISRLTRHRLAANFN